MIFKQARAGNYSKGRTGSIKYIVVHFTANNGDTAQNNLNYFANNVVSASAHYFVDEKEVCQSVKESDMAYHCGAKKYRHSECRNYNSIGIEMCSRKDGAGKYYIKEETVVRTAELVKSLMKKYKIPVSRVLRHYDVTGKNCPAPFVENSALWKNFLGRLGDDEVIKPIKIKVNGVMRTVNAIEKDGFNYVKLRDLADAKISIGYDKVPIVEVKDNK